jgi:hypothetical protein
LRLKTLIGGQRCAEIKVFDHCDQPRVGPQSVGLRQMAHAAEVVDNREGSLALIECGLPELQNLPIALGAQTCQGEVVQRGNVARLPPDTFGKLLLRRRPVTKHQGIQKPEAESHSHVAPAILLEFQ